MEAAVVFYWLKIAFWVAVGFWILGTNYKEGLWGNAVVVVNGICAFPLAVAIGHGATMIVLAQSGVGDVFARRMIGMAFMWVMFAGVLALFRTLTDRLSRTKVRFFKPIDRAGSMVFIALSWLGLALYAAFVSAYSQTLLT